MHVREYQATLLRSHALGEQDLILTWCAARGLFKTVAKHARSPKSPFAGKTDLFYHCTVQWAAAKSGELHYLRAVQVLSPRLGLRASYLQLTAAAYFARLLLKLPELNTPIPEFYDLLMRAFAYLEQQPPTLKAIVHFEREFARHYGILHPSRAPHKILQEHFGSLPPQRDKLLSLLESGTRELK